MFLTPSVKVRDYAHQYFECVFEYIEVLARYRLSRLERFYSFVKATFKKGAITSGAVKAYLPFLSALWNLFTRTGLTNFRPVT